MILQNALGVLTRSRGKETRLSDDEYVTSGKRANASEVFSPAQGGHFADLCNEDVLSDVLDAPYALQRIKDLRAAMQLVVTRAGEHRDDLFRHEWFHTAFAAFSLGFAMGLALSHRAKDANIPIAHLSQATVSRCEEWGMLIALAYLVQVDTRGIIDKKTDFSVYGIADRWRAVADEKRITTHPELRECVRAGRSAGKKWLEEETTDIGGALVQALETLAAGRRGHAAGRTA